MVYHTLGSSGLQVSEVCLGSMTWGLQNNQSDADSQIEYALSQGINFIDTAEMYAVPPSPETYGKTESIIGNWIERNRAKRDTLILATKIAGPGMHWVREGAPITGADIRTSVEKSLQRLRTDYLDLYQLHWPNRRTPHFNQQWPNQVPFDSTNGAEHKEQMHEILQALSSEIDRGTIRHIGLSDDTPWGIQTYLQLADQFSLPRMVSIQNEFSILHAKDWPYLIEQCIHEEVAYLPWSPLAGGLLSGKYAEGARPVGSRWTLEQRNGIFRDTPLAHKAVEAYATIAREENITPAQLALAWCKQINGVTSTIIGATSQKQLKEDIQAFDLLLSQEAITKIDAEFRRYPMPF